MLPVMDRRAYRWIALFLLAWLPVQAVAVPLLAGCCPDRDRTEQAAMHDCHQQAEATDEMPAAGHDDGDHALNPGHLCCPHFSAVATIRFGMAAESVPFEAPAPVFRAYTFFPEQPQRPPRT
jgi:hypothetical protein